MTSPAMVATAVAASARRRIGRRILPYLFVLYVIAYLDRVNLGYAALEMSGELGFSPEVYGLGAGIFFLGYFLLEIPGAILVERWSARKWIARIMISWGLVAMCTGFVQTAHQLYMIRFLLGAAEAGFFPGIIVYLSHWFRNEDRAKAMALFVAAQPISNIIGSPISGLLLGIHWLGISGWRWLFLLEGVPAVVLGVVTLFFLTDWPHQAKWMPEVERQWIAAELDREKRAKLVEHSFSVLQVVAVLFLFVALFGMNVSIYGFNFWLPTIIKKLSGSSNLLVTTLSALPYCVGLIALPLIGWSSDRTGERRWHTALSMIVVSVGLALSLCFPGSAVFALAMFCIAAIGMYGYLPGFWALPVSFLNGTAAAACIGLINSVGNLGGFVGPFIVGRLTKTTHSFFAGILFLSLSALMAGLLVLCVRTGKRQAGMAAEATG